MPKQYKYTKSFTFEGKRYVVRDDTEKDAIIKMANRLRDLEEGKVTINNSMTVIQWDCYHCRHRHCYKQQRK